MINPNFKRRVNSNLVWGLKTKRTRLKTCLFVGKTIIKLIFSFIIVIKAEQKFFVYKHLLGRK